MHAPTSAAIREHGMIYSFKALVLEIMGLSLTCFLSYSHLPVPPNLGISPRLLRFGLRSALTIAFVVLDLKVNSVWLRGCRVEALPNKRLQSCYLILEKLLLLEKGITNTSHFHIKSWVSHHFKYSDMQGGLPGVEDWPWPHLSKFNVHVGHLQLLLKRIFPSSMRKVGLRVCISSKF